MLQEPYYLAYERRYKTVFSAGVPRWGHAPDDRVLEQTLKSWVSANHLKGKRILEFACGEGACGVILTGLGCQYHGIDIAPTAIEKAKEVLKGRPNATVEVLDMVKDAVKGPYDAALDCMGLHMLVTDTDRSAYLKNAYNALKPGAPMLFFRQLYPGPDQMPPVYRGAIHSFEQFKSLSGADYDTPQLRSAHLDGEEVQVLIPLVPARANDREGYSKEMERAGFRVEQFIEMGESQAIEHAASIYVRK